jgi:hypothetical protein
VTVADPAEFEIGKTYDALAIDREGAHPVRATISEKSGSDVGGTFVSKAAE